MYPDEKGVIRTIKVKTEHDIFLRATNLVVPIELSCENYPPEGEILQDTLLTVYFFLSERIAICLERKTIT